MSEVLSPGEEYEKWKPEGDPRADINGMLEEDFVKQYPENGFGWAPTINRDNRPEAAARNELAQQINVRWEEIKSRRPEFIPPGPIKSRETADVPIMPDQPLRNLDGQVVSPRTNEPVQPGSPEWRELAERNQLPFNQ